MNGTIDLNYVAKILEVVPELKSEIKEMKVKIINDDQRIARQEELNKIEKAQIDKLHHEECEGYKTDLSYLKEANGKLNTDLKNKNIIIQSLGKSIAEKYQKNNDLERDIKETRNENKNLQFNLQAKNAEIDDLKQDITIKNRKLMSCKIILLKKNNKIHIYKILLTIKIEEFLLYKMIFIIQNKEIEI